MKIKYYINAMSDTVSKNGYTDCKHELEHHSCQSMMVCCLSAQIHDNSMECEFVSSFRPLFLNFFVLPHSFSELIFYNIMVLSPQ